MPVSSQVRATDVKAMLRLVGELGEIKTVTARQQRLWEGISHLVGGGKGCVMGTIEFVKGSTRPIILESKTANGLWDAPSEQKVWLDYTHVGYYDADPFFRYMLPRMRQTMTISRKQAVDNPSWYGSPYVHAIRRGAGSDDFIHSQFYEPETGILYALAISRRWNDKPFGERERLIVELLHGEIVVLQRRGLFIAQRDFTADLPQRLQRVLLCLLQGKSEKETAQTLDLSGHTVHGYVKDIYLHFGVASRAELLARWIAQNPELSLSPASSGDLSEPRPSGSGS